MDDKILKPEDYLEPNCPLCEKPYGAEAEIKPVPQQRIIEKMDEYMSHRDYAGAERHLLYWLEEARLGQDKRGELMIRNELVGHYRKTGQKQEAFAHAKEALRLIQEMEYEGTISSATTYVNIATAYNAFEENEQAYALFAKALPVYESSANTRKDLLGGLYNNMALTCVSLGRYEEARALYDKALMIMEEAEHGKLEQAITWLNIADCITLQKGMDNAENEIYACLDTAESLLKDESLEHNGYYAFVLEKCAPVFSYYGYFLLADELKEKAEMIYAGS